MLNIHAPPFSLSFGSVSLAFLLGGESQIFLFFVSFWVEVVIVHNYASSNADLEVTWFRLSMLSAIASNCLAISNFQRLQ